MPFVLSAYAYMAYDAKFMWFIGFVTMTCYINALQLVKVNRENTADLVYKKPKRRSGGKFRERFEKAKRGELE
jgi:hypothetical protein